jgi:hypothetical protein
MASMMLQNPFMAPYADPNDRRRWERERYRRKYRGDRKFREREAQRKKPWYANNRNEIVERLRLRKAALAGQWQALAPVADLFNEPSGFLKQFATLRTWLRCCTKREIPAKKLRGKWHTSLAAIAWYLWQGADEAFKEHYSAPSKPDWVEPLTGLLIVLSEAALQF